MDSGDTWTITICWYLKINKGKDIMSAKRDDTKFFAYRGENNEVREPYYFITDEAGNPEKVGDGTYGAVFGVKNVDGERYVVKIFYETLTTPRLSLLKLTDEHLIGLNDRINESDHGNDRNKIKARRGSRNESLKESGNTENATESSNSTIEKLRDLQKRHGDKPFSSIGQFASELQELDLPQDHLQCVLDYFQSSPTSFEQFTKEMTASVQMREALRDERMIGVVNIEGNTTVFKDESDAFKKFRQNFEAMQIDISNYALVMKRYEYTLKDILENAVRKTLRIRENDERLDQKLLEICKKLNAENFEESDQVRQAIKNESELNENEHTLLESLIYRPSGYDVLQSLNFEERVRTILPFLIQIAHGVRTIHKARQYHFDLKPANILVNDELGIPDVVVGDLGSIQHKEVSASTSSLDISVDMQDILLLGTRHYRSPEQKDYFDVCNVKIVHRNSDVVLEVTDRKFEDTIIEDGDQVVFSKASDPSVRYLIDKIVPQDIGDAICAIILSPQTRQETLQPDDKTQVMLYKKQSARTDLFGLGAIAYDLITCGQSPERFYDSIRNYDHQDESVKNILDKYEQLTLMHGSTDPTIRSIFAPFIQNRSSVDPKLIEFILKCLLYQAKGTYYNPEGDLAASKKSEKASDYHFAVEAALASLEILSAKFKPDPKNKLLPSTTSAFDPPPPDYYFFEELNRLQEMTSQTDFPERLAQGMVLFQKVFNLVSEEISKMDGIRQGSEGIPESDSETHITFAEMIPQNMVKTEKELNFKSRIYESYREYKEDLRGDYVHFRLNRDAQNPYVPLDFIAIRRRLKFQKAEGKFFQYRFLDSSPGGGTVNKHDWIVGKQMLWRVSSVHDSIPNQITLQPVNDQHLDSQEDAGIPVPGNTGFEDDEYVYYQNLDPVRYYLNMLGIYLHQIFFANLGRTTRDRPEAVDIAQKIITVRGIDKVTFIYQASKFGSNFDGVVKLIAQMYARLTMYGHLEPRSAQNAQDCFNQVRKENDQLRNIIANFLGVDHASDLYRVRREDYDSNWFNKNIPKDKIENFDFNDLILNFVRKNNLGKGRLF